MKRNRITNVIIGLLIFGVVAVGYLYFTGGNESSQDEYLTVEVSRGAIRRTVSSTGTLQAVITVQVGSQVSGRIKELHADFNSVVKKNQVLAVIDPANFEAQVDRARAALAMAQATVKNAEANLINRKAEVASAEANLEAARVAQKEAERQLRRDRGLFEDRLVSERELESSQAVFDQNTARVHQAEAQVNQAEASIRSALAQQEQAAANVKQALAELQMVEVNLRYTKILSPIDGVVVERNVDIGQTVAASFQAPVLFLIANDLSKMQVIAQIDEADIGVISEKAGVDFTVDAFPAQTFSGKISEIRLSSNLPGGAANSTAAAGSGGGATNVVVYNVIIDVDNPQLKLRPAMTATVTFTVASVESTLKVANAALRYRPSDKSPEEIGKLLSSFATAASANSQPEEGAPRNPGAPENKGRRPGGPGWGGGWDGGDRSAQPGRGTQLVIGPSTIEQYGIKAGPKIRFSEVEDSRPRRSVLWVLDENGQLQPRRVRLGITDGRETAIVAGELEEGEIVVTWKIDDGEVREATSPFSGAFGPRRRRTDSRSGRTGGRRGGR